MRKRLGAIAAAALLVGGGVAIAHPTYPTVGRFERQAGPGADRIVSRGCTTKHEWLRAQVTSYTQDRLVLKCSS